MRISWRTTAPILVLSLWLAMICGVAAVAETIHSEAPAGPRRTLELQEQWRVGGEDADLMFGLMIEALTDDRGNVYLLDQQLCNVTVVDPDGQVTGTLGRQGEGPGEIRTPQGICFMPDGVLAVAEQFPGKLIRLLPNGDPGGTVTLGRGTEGGFTAVSSCRGRAGNLLLGALFQAPIEHGQSRQSYLATVSIEGQEQVRFREHTTNLDFEKAHFIEREMLAPFLGAHALGPDGRVYALRDRNEYLIDVFAPDGTLERSISRRFEPVARSQREKDRINELFEVQDRNLPFDITWEIEQYEQAVNGIFVDLEGQLWVEHARSSMDQPPGVLTTYDVFGVDGQWLEEVSVACGGDPAYDGILPLEDGRLLLVKGLVLARLTASGSQGAVFDEEGGDAAQEVICYQVGQ